MTAERHGQHPSLEPQERSRASEEDYLACILGSLEQKGYARVVDVAQSLSITQASVSAMVKRLAARGYVQRERYRGFTLTTAAFLPGNRGKPEAKAEPIFRPRLPLP